MAATTASESAFLWACRLDVDARKPGNVSVASPGHGMQADDFLRSARAAASPLCRRGAPVGRRIEDAMRATWNVVQCNTNLGILLLCAPLLRAHDDLEPESDAAALRQRLRIVLDTLDLDDARCAYRAIALANPGGLGSAPEQDVRDAPTVGLREAMALASHRDRVARQYVTVHDDVFDLGLPAFLDEWRRDADPTGDHADAGRCTDPATRALQRVFLEFVAAFPDSHIVRRHGPALAHSVMGEAAPWRDRARRGELLSDDPAFRDWDEGLKARRINPGTSADLCVAVALVAALLAPSGMRPFEV